jgi:hypothetical protein
VAAHTITASDEQLFTTFELERNGRGKRLQRLLTGFRRANVPPNLLSGLRVQRQQVGIIGAGFAAAIHCPVALKNLHVKSAIIERGTGREGPEERERPIILLQIARPGLFSFKIEGGKFTVAVKEINELAICDGRG